MNGWTIATIVVNAVLLTYFVVMLCVMHHIKKKRLNKSKKELEIKQEGKDNE